jgi:hypothetical protein
MIVGYLCACAAIGGWVCFGLWRLWDWAQLAKLRAIAREGAVQRGFDPRRQAQDVLTPEAYDRLAKERGW